MHLSKKALLLVLVIPLLITLLPLIAQSAENIKIEGFINDYANIISPEYKSKIEGILKGVYDAKAAEFSIVTINSLEGQDIESYALNLAQGELGDKQKNNGLLLLVAVRDRKYRFEVGRGLEPVLNDAKIGRIGRAYLVENFRNEDYGKGIYEASLAVKTTLLGETDSGYYIDDDAPKKIKPIIIILIFLILWILIITLVVSIKMRSYKKHIKKKDDYFGAALMAAWLFGGRGRGGSGGGFSSGGFGGFGGGGFGGGGAGSGW